MWKEFETRAQRVCQTAFSELNGARKDAKKDGPRVIIYKETSPTRDSTFSYYVVHIKEISKRNTYFKREIFAFHASENLTVGTSPFVHFKNVLEIIYRKRQSANLAWRDVTCMSEDAVKREASTFIYN